MTYLESIDINKDGFVVSIKEITLNINVSSCKTAPKSDV